MLSWNAGWTTKGWLLTSPHPGLYTKSRQHECTHSYQSLRVVENESLHEARIEL